MPITTPMNIKILIADDHQIFLDGLKSILSEAENIQIVGEANNGEMVLDCLDTHSGLIDIAVLDIEMEGLDGIETARIIRNKYPQTKILVLSMYKKPQFILELMQLGISGYILKNKSKEHLIQALHQIKMGNTHFGLEVMNALANNPTINEPEAVELTEREIEVLKWIAEGLPAKNIADKLGIKETTVNTHKRNLRSKLDAPNDKFLVRYAIEKRYI